VSISAGLAAFKISFQLSPIILTGGIAASIPGGALPIIALTEALNFFDGILSGATGLEDLDNFFANFHPLPGATLIDQSVGEYPFANQAVAANAVIRNPNVISLRMICPARNELGYAVKLATMTALQATLAQHNASGGTYVVATPSFFFTDCLLLRMTDVTPERSNQAQEVWQLDFRKPLLTLQDAVQSQNSLMGKITSGVPLGSGTPAWSGLGPQVGNPASLGTIGTMPSAANPAGSLSSSPQQVFSAGGSQ